MLVVALVVADRQEGVLGLAASRSVACVCYRDTSGLQEDRVGWARAATSAVRFLFLLLACMAEFITGEVRAFEIDLA